MPNDAQYGNGNTRSCRSPEPPFQPGGQVPKSPPRSEICGRGPRQGKAAPRTITNPKNESSCNVWALTGSFLHVGAVRQVVQLGVVVVVVQDAFQVGAVQHLRRQLSRACGRKTHTHSPSPLPHVRERPFASTHGEDDDVTSDERRATASPATSPRSGLARTRARTVSVESCCRGRVEGEGLHWADAERCSLLLLLCLFGRPAVETSGLSTPRRPDVASTT